MMQLGELLSKSLAEIRRLPSSELTLWMAYFSLKNEPKEEKKEVDDVSKFKHMMQR